MIYRVPVHLCSPTKFIHVSTRIAGKKNVIEREIKGMLFCSTLSSIQPTQLDTEPIVFSLPPLFSAAAAWQKQGQSRDCCRFPRS